MIACPNCRTILPVEIANSGQLHPCPECQGQVRADIFNAFHRPVDQHPVGTHVQVQGQAECFYHPGKIANTPCSSCGRLLCSLCEIAIDNQTLCPNCLQTGWKKEKIQSLEKGRVLYDSMALHLAFWPLLLFPFFMVTIVTAPVVLFLVLRNWKSASSGVLPRSKFRFVLAFIIAVGQLIGWVAIVFSMFT